MTVSTGFTLTLPAFTATAVTALLSIPSSWTVVVSTFTPFSVPTCKAVTSWWAAVADYTGSQTTADSTSCITCTGFSRALTESAVPTGVTLTLTAVTVTLTVAFCSFWSGQTRGGIHWTNVAVLAVSTELESFLTEQLRVGNGQSDPGQSNLFYRFVEDQLDFSLFSEVVYKLIFLVLTLERISF